jgi:quercetin dioxygenase-like cupin family protein
MDDGVEPICGEPACSAAQLSADGGEGRSLVVHELDRAVGAAGLVGAVWSLPHDGDLDANLVRLDPGRRIGEHVNADLDVLIVVRRGTGEIVIDGVRHPIAAGDIALVRRGARRAIAAGPAELLYLTVHRRRGELGIRSRT